jgi:chorismate mutase
MVEVGDIDQLRDRIDDIDRRLVALLSERAACALEIGRLKELCGLPIYQPSREIDVLRNVSEANPGPLDNEAVIRVFERIIDEARRLERIAARRRDARDGPV